MSILDSARKLSHSLETIRPVKIETSTKKTTTKDTKTDTKKTTSTKTDTKKTTTKEPWTLKTVDEKKATEKSPSILDAAWKLSGKERPSGAKYSSAPSSSKTETNKTRTTDRKKLTANFKSLFFIVFSYAVYCTSGNHSKTAENRNGFNACVGVVL